MKHFLFLDESGDHGLANIDPGFPVFVLCGILIPEPAYDKANQAIIDLKKKFWGDKKVILHSRDIRKCEKEFQILFDLELKKQFYEGLNEITSQSDYTIISSSINKEKHIEKYGRLVDDVYEIALSYIIETAVFYLDDVNHENNTLQIIIEKRGKKEDQKLSEHFQKILSRGTDYVAPERLKEYQVDIDFKDKKENENGLQLADLVAYPIARYLIEPDRANPAYNVIEPKIYVKDNLRLGLKTFP